MADREKLIDFIVEAMPPCYSDVFACRIADHLISHGVTVRERGRWEDVRGIPSVNRKDVPIVKCSKCKIYFCDLINNHHYMYHFCPHCGADMRPMEEANV